MSSLFEAVQTSNAPLADRLRPEEFHEVVGQSHLLSGEADLAELVKQERLPSLILWGPPGCGKTTLARIIAQKSGCEIEILSAVTSGVADLKKAFERAQQRKQDGKQTLLFVDEIHRFNRAQQDAFLPYVEDGTITLIGATTENPSFELNAALLSRSKLLVLSRLEDTALEKLLQRAESLHDKQLPIDEEARKQLIAMADGDGRALINMAEELLTKASPEQPYDREALAAIIGKRMMQYDKSQEGHYNLISALHKSVRGSDVQAALYWFSRMLEGGEEPLYLARRLVRMAVEDIGMADPNALTQAIAAQQSYSLLGSPEGELALAQTVVYLATAPKSNAAYVAFKAASKAAKENGSLMPPAHILNAPTNMMKELGYGKDYAYDHDAPDGFSGQNYFPDDLPRQEFYTPPERGFEREIKKRLDYWAKLRKQRNA
jgi:putative ATPase